MNNQAENLQPTNTGSLRQRLTIPFRFNGKAYQGIEISPVSYDPDSRSFQVLEGVDDINDPAIFAWAVYGINHQDTVDHIADTGSQAMASALANAITSN